MASVQIGTKSVGSIVRMKVNGTAREFIVVHQGKPSSLYDDSCTGTWLLMKDLYESRQWHSSDVNDYANSTIHSYLNSTFLNLFEADIKNAIKQVKVPYRPGSGTSQTVNSGANGLSCKVFLLSDIEVGYTQSNVNQYIVNDGTKLNYFLEGNGGSDTTDGQKRIGYLSGTAAYWWLRSPHTYDSTVAWYVGSNGNASSNGCSGSYGVRPALVLPSSLLVSEDGSVSTNTPPVISGTDTNLGDLSDPPSIIYQVSDPDGDAVNVTEMLNTKTLRTLNNAPKSTDTTLTVTGGEWAGLAINTQHSLTIDAVDGKGGTTTRTYTFRRVNAAPLITGVDGSIGDKNAPFEYVYQVTDPDGDDVSVVERFNGQAIRTLNNATQGSNLAVTIDSGKLASVAINSTASITIEVTDTNGNTSYRNITFRRVNASAVIVSAFSSDLGLRSSAPAITYHVSDPEGDSITVVEKLNNTILRTISPATPNTDITIEIPASAWIKLGLEQHTITVRATDSHGAYSDKVFTFTRTDDRAQLEMLNALVTTDMAGRIVPSVNAIMPTGSILTVEVCNNGLDEEPAWEDATTETVQRKAYAFHNDAKTADNWGIKMRVTLERGDAVGECAIFGYGAAFE